MYKLSQLLSKEVINVTNATSYGRLVNIGTCSEHKSYIITDSADILACDNMSINEAITTSSSPISAIDNVAPLTPIGGKCIDTKGKGLGMICDYELTNAMVLRRIITDKQGYSIDKVTAFNTEISVLNRVKAAPAVTKQFPHPTVMLEESNGNITVISDYSFLLNRRVTRDMHTRSGNLIIAVNTIINNAVIANARMNNKLVELALYSEIIR